MCILFLIVNIFILVPVSFH